MQNRVEIASRTSSTSAVQAVGHSAHNYGAMYSPSFANRYAASQKSDHKQYKQDVRHIKQFFASDDWQDNLQELGVTEPVREIAEVTSRQTAKGGERLRSRCVLYGDNAKILGVLSVRAGNGAIEFEPDASRYMSSVQLAANGVSHAVRSGLSTVGGWLSAADALVSSLVPSFPGTMAEAVIPGPVPTAPQAVNSVALDKTSIKAEIKQTIKEKIKAETFTFYLKQEGKDIHKLSRVRNNIIELFGNLASESQEDLGLVRECLKNTVFQVVQPEDMQAYMSDKTLNAEDASFSDLTAWMTTDRSMIGLQTGFEGKILYHAIRHECTHTRDATQKYKMANIFECNSNLRKLLSETQKCLKNSKAAGCAEIIEGSKAFDENYLTVTPVEGGTTVKVGTIVWHHDQQVALTAVDLTLKKYILSPVGGNVSPSLVQQVMILGEVLDRANPERIKQTYKPSHFETECHANLIDSIPRSILNKYCPSLVIGKPNHADYIQRQREQQDKNKEL